MMLTLFFFHSVSSIIVNQDDKFYAERVLQELQVSQQIISIALRDLNDCSDIAMCSIHSPCVLCNEQGRVSSKFKFFFN